MLVSLNWIRDFVDLPTDLDPRALAEKFTVTTAEVEGIEQITCDAVGLVAAEILSTDFSLNCDDDVLFDRIRFTIT